MKKEKTKIIHCYVDPVFHERVNSWAEENGYNVSVLVRSLLAREMKEKGAVA